ncbi:hypothetical protein OG474_08880 [Kribbella sp. NBC_01505]|uniref:hypothetical protein n=1 Tax=Kribbella sp. NBC_01505 TaxID=2903580 RepID=UPI00386E9D7E
MLGKVAVLGLIQNYLVGWVLHYVYPPVHQAAPTAHHGTGTPEHAANPLLHFLRDSTIALPVSIAVLIVVAVLARELGLGEGIWSRVGFAAGAAVVAAAANVLTVHAHQPLFVALVTLRYTFALTLAAVVLFGVPWRITSAGEAR